MKITNVSHNITHKSLSNWSFLVSWKKISVKPTDIGRYQCETNASLLVFLLTYIFFLLLCLHLNRMAEEKQETWGENGGGACTKQRRHWVFTPRPACQGPQPQHMGAHSTPAKLAPCMPTFKWSSTDINFMVRWKTSEDKLKSYFTGFNQAQSESAFKDGHYKYWKGVQF